MAEERWVLHCKNKSGGSKSLILAPGGAILLGRGGNHHFTPLDREISRIHGAFFFPSASQPGHGNQAFYVDCGSSLQGSRNGSYVLKRDGQQKIFPMARYPIKDGMKLVMGQTKIHVEKVSRTATLAGKIEEVSGYKQELLEEIGSILSALAKQDTEATIHSPIKTHGPDEKK